MSSSVQDIGDITSFKWATVTTVTPLGIKLDGDTATLGMVPDSLVDPASLSVGSRVRVELSLRKAVIHGASGGSSSFASGDLKPTAARVIQTGWLACDGTAYLRATYPALFAALNPVIGTTTVTIATPGVFTLNAHGMQTGQMIYLTTTGALPTGLAINTLYYVVRVDANTFSLATTLANALAGTKIATSGVQSGVHTLRTTWGIGNGTTTFNVPDSRGKVLVGVDSAQTEFASLGQAGGEKAHTLTAAELPQHDHGGSTASAAGWPYSANIYGTGGSTSLFQPITWQGALIGGDPTYQNRTNHAHAITGAGLGGGSHNNIQPYVTVNYIIKT